MGGGEISKISLNWGEGANKLKWAEKIENSVIDPPIIKEGRVCLLHFKSHLNAFLRDQTS